MSETTVNWQASIRLRVLIAAGFLGLWVVGIEARLIYLQIYARPDLMKRAEIQQERQLTLPAERGDIVDRNGNVFATSANAPSIVAYPSKVEDPQDVITQLCRAFRNCTRDERETWLKRFNEGGGFAYIRRHVTDEEAERIKVLELSSIGIQQETRRHYPNKGLAAHILGFVGRDSGGRENNGLAGIEATYDKYIRGRDGVAEVVVDSKKRPFSSVQQAPTTGSTVQLTIDQNLQHIAERELAAGVRENRAAGGSVIILDPATGDILAMASDPPFNPNEFASFDPVIRRNRAVQDLYEPGSTFKVVTASAALEEGTHSPTDPIDVSGGLIRISASRVVDDEHAYGVLSFSDVIVKSSNVGAIKIGFRLGPQVLGSFVRRFGFGRQASRDFPGESYGLVSDPATWGDGTLASVSMGYEIGVTPLQMVTAVSSIANGGRLMEPHIVRSVRGPGVNTESAPRIVGRTVSAETAATMTGIMEGVVEAGTAKAAQIPGYTIAGKTGTAAKAIRGGYSKSDYNASFVGFLPSRDPAVTIIVVIDSPHAKGIYGGVVAAPIFQRIAAATMNYMGVAPSINRQPPLLVGPRDQPQPVIRTVATPVRAELPRIMRISPDTPPGTLPDLRGMSLRDATRSLAARGLEVEVSGDGNVVLQEPAPGTAMSEGVVTLTLSSGSRPTGGRATGQP